jgi:uncharacterized damage-inducible protein DinB
MSKKIQELVELLSSERQKVLEAIDGLSPAQLEHRPGEGLWSISDILHHLALTEEAHGKLMSRILKQAESGSLAPDPSPDQSVLDCLDAYAEKLRNTKATAPDFVAPKEHAPAADSLARLEAALAGVIDKVKQLGPYDLSQVSYPHPVLGPLNTYQWIVISGRHEGRHASQIRRIKRGEDFPAS